MVRGRMEKIKDKEHRLTRPLKQEAGSVDLFFLKPEDFDLLDRATQ